MTDTFKEICWGIMNGFRDAILGAVSVYKMDSPTKPASPKREEEETVLARRRRQAEKSKSREKQKKDSEPRVLHRIFQCCALNGGVFWLSIQLFNSVLLPCLQWLTGLISGATGTSTVWMWVGPMLSWTFSALWILPLFVLSKIVNCFWFQDVADLAYRKYRGRPQLLKISLFLSDMLFSLIFQTLFLIQSMLASFLPIPAVGQAISLLHMSLLYSLYAFEYKWINMGWEVHKRLSHIEKLWPYFCGFGIPLAVLTSLPSSFVVSGCVFAILFPLFLISANEANDTKQSFKFPLKLFAPMVTVTDTVFHKILPDGKQTSVSSQSTSPKKQTRISEDMPAQFR